MSLLDPIESQRLLDHYRKTKKGQTATTGYSSEIYVDNDSKTVLKLQLLYRPESDRSNFHSLQIYTEAYYRDIDDEYLQWYIPELRSKIKKGDLLSEDDFEQVESRAKHNFVDEVEALQIASKAKLTPKTTGAGIVPIDGNDNLFAYGITVQRFLPFVLSQEPENSALFLCGVNGGLESLRDTLWSMAKLNLVHVDLNVGNIGCYPNLGNLQILDWGDVLVDIDALSEDLGKCKNLEEVISARNFYVIVSEFIRKIKCGYGTLFGVVQNEVSPFQVNSAIIGPLEQWKEDAHLQLKGALRRSGCTLKHTPFKDIVDPIRYLKR